MNHNVFQTPKWLSPLAKVPEQTLLRFSEKAPASPGSTPDWRRDLAVSPLVRYALLYGLYLFEVTVDDIIVISSACVTACCACRTLCASCALCICGTLSCLINLAE